MKPIDILAEFNALPRHIRLIGCEMENAMRIQYLRAEKGRVLRYARKRSEEIDAEITAHELAIANVRQEYAESLANDQDQT